MGFFDFFEKETTTEKINRERNKIKTDMGTKLEQIGFTTEEISSVLDIITVAEEKIAELKKSLIGTNINTQDPTPIMNKVFGEIRQIEQQMGVDLKNKINEIKTNKQS